jgi:phosphoglycolate phosphatase-like HAD superfamily hydrolase
VHGLRLAAIKREGGRIAIATDCTNPALSNYCEVLGVDDLIDVIACEEDVKEGKPAAGWFASRPSGAT